MTGPHYEREADGDALAEAAHRAMDGDRYREGP